MEIKNRKFVFTLLHIAAWIFVFILPLYFFNSAWARNSSFLGRYYVSAFIYGFIFYLNYILLVPGLYLSNKRGYYFLLVTVIIIGLYFVEGYLTRHLFSSTETELQIQELLKQFSAEHNLSKPPFGQLHLFNYLLVSILISGFSIGLRIAERYDRQEKQEKDLEKTKLVTELTFLKNQVSPHFFFNTLNNIYSLIEINSQDAQKSVLQLSKLMRYLLYESDQPLVSLSRELEFMNNYIELMKLRLSKKVDLKVSFPELKIDFRIPPLLFIPFLENAFKHGVSYKEKCFIHISLHIHEETLAFDCSNRIVDNENGKEKLFTGIGLENVKKRLDLLYPDQSELKLDQSANVFQVSLRIRGLKKAA